MALMFLHKSRFLFDTITDYKIGASRMADANLPIRITTLLLHTITRE